MTLERTLQLQFEDWALKLKPLKDEGIDINEFVYSDFKDLKHICECKGLDYLPYFEVYRKLLYS